METIKNPRSDLESDRFIFREIGLIISLLLILAAFNLKTNYQSNGINDHQTNKIEIEEMAPITIQKTSLPPPPPQIQQVTILHVVEDEVEVETELEINAEADQGTVIEEFVPYTPTEDNEEEFVDDEVVFVIVESMPSFPGGLNTLKQYLHNNIHYPQLAKESGIQGKVFLSFVVEKDGAVTDVEILRGIGGGCDEEAVRVVQQMPNWTPGRQRNIPVRVRFTLPVKFTLQ